MASSAPQSTHALDSQAEVDLIVEQGRCPDLYNIQLDDAIEVGPFEGSGLDMRTAGVLAAFRCVRLCIALVLI